MSKSAWPAEGTKARALIDMMMRGERVDPFTVLMELNLMTFAARMAELRAQGWPIRRVDVPHPKLPRERVPTYILDKHFRDWMAENKNAQPFDYPYDDGRGKFTRKKP